MSWVFKSLAHLVRVDINIPIFKMRKLRFTKVE